MSATAALRMDAGLAQVVMPQAILHKALSLTPELIGLALVAFEMRALLNACGKAESIVLGPGLGRSARAKNRVLKYFDSIS
jgi:NAD(P)H-hydrate repair Nnr-like enzyme with NAD(P)H-hydrate dehydratase domain